MVNSEQLQVRTAFAKEVAQKAEALRVEAQIEVYRYEGAVAALRQALQIARPAKQEPVAQCDVVSGIEALVERAHGELMVARGRVQQGERTLDMLEALFQADVSAAQQLLEKKDLPEPVRGRHPGPSIKTKRTAKTKIDAQS